MSNLHYVHYDKDTKQILGWYSSEIHATPIDGGYDISDIPTPSIEVSKTVWQNAIDNNHNAFDLHTKTTSDQDIRSVVEKERDAKLSEKSGRTRAIKESTVSNTAGIFQADEDSLSSMATTVTALDPGETVSWRLKDNTNVELTREELKEILKLGVLNRNLLVEGV